MLGFTAYAANRWLVVFWRQAQIIHTISALLIFIFTAVAAGAAIQKEQGEVDPELHNILGVVVLGLVSLLTLQGMGALLIRLYCKWNQDIIRKTRAFHKFLGILSFITSFIAVSSGLIVYYRKLLAQGKEAVPLHNVNIVLSLLILIVFEIVNYYYRYGAEVKLEIKNEEFAGLVMTEKDFTRFV